MATARNQSPVTKHDTNPNVFDALFVGGAGDVTFLDKDGTTATWTVPAGAYILCATSKVMSTGTTATNIVGLLF